MFRITAILGVLLVFVLNLNGQTDKYLRMDSIRLTPTQFKICSTLYKTGDRHFYDWQLDSAKYYYNRLIPLAERYKAHDMLILAITGIGTCHLDASVPDSALYYYNKAIDKLEKLEMQGKEVHLSALYFNIGLTYDSELGDSKRGVSAFFKALEYGEAAKDFEGMIDAYKGIAIAYVRYDYKKATIYAEKGLELALSEGTPYDVAEFKRVLGKVILSRDDTSEQYLKGLNLLRESIDYYSTQERPYELADSYAGLVTYFLSVNSTDSAVYYSQKAYDLYLKLDSKSAVLSTAVDLGGALNHAGRSKEAIPLLLNAIAQADSLDNIELLSLLSGTVSNSYENLGSYKSALFHFKKYKFYNDTLFHRNRSELTSELQEKFHSQWLESERAQLEEKNQMLAKERKIYSILGILLTAGILGIFVFYFRLRRKKALIDIQKSKLAELDETKSKLFAILGHELRGPLIGFTGLAEKISYLIKKNDFERIPELSVTLDKSSRHITEILDNLLSWAVQQRERMHSKPTLIGLDPVIRNCKTYFADRLKQKSLSCEINVESGTQIYFDEHNLDLIIRNLVSNAVKFTPEGGMIQIHSTKKPESVILVIEDNGVGMEEEVRNSIRNKSLMESIKGTKGEKGLGIGWQICKILLKQNNADFNIQSVKGEGTKIELIFPRQLN